MEALGVIGSLLLSARFALRTCPFIESGQPGVPVLVVLATASQFRVILAVVPGSMVKVRGLNPSVEVLLEMVWMINGALPALVIGTEPVASLPLAAVPRFKVSGATIRGVGFVLRSNSFCH